MKTRMERWRIIGNADGALLTGVVSGHPRIKSGRVVVSTALVEVALDDPEPWVRSKNTLYYLDGDPRPPIQPPRERYTIEEVGEALDAEINSQVVMILCQMVPPTRQEEMAKIVIAWLANDKLPSSIAKISKGRKWQ